MVDRAKLQRMDAKADDVIAGFTAGAFAGNLLPPPFDTVAVGTVIAENLVRNMLNAQFWRKA